jgi:hypothetical protein
MMLEITEIHVNYFGALKMALWDSKQGIQLLKTEDSNVYFVNVDAKPASYDTRRGHDAKERISILKPFMELKEVGSTWHIGEEGWLIPKAKFPFLALFMRLISEYESDDEVEIRQNRASQYMIGRNTMGILLSLYDRKVVEKALAEQKSKLSDLENPALLESFVDKVVEGIIKASPGFLDLVLRYVMARVQELNKGDIVIIREMDYGYDGERLIPFLMNREDNHYHLPEQFKTPPYPIMHWEERDKTTRVHPDFDLEVKGVKTVLEFDDGAPKLEPILTNPGEIDENTGESDPDTQDYLAGVFPESKLVALLVTPPPPYKPFYVYFQAEDDDYVLTQEDISNYMRDPEAWYEPFNENTIIGYIGHIASTNANSLMNALAKK